FVLHRPPPPELYTLSLHDALPIFLGQRRGRGKGPVALRQAGAGKLAGEGRGRDTAVPPARTLARRALSRAASALGVDARTAFRLDRKSTRLNSSHVKISYAVFCLK